MADKRKRHLTGKWSDAFYISIILYSVSSREVDVECHPCSAGVFIAPELKDKRILRYIKCAVCATEHIDVIERTEVAADKRAIAVITFGLEQEVVTI
jgi:hypothetical protein